MVWPVREVARKPLAIWSTARWEAARNATVLPKELDFITFASHWPPGWTISINRLKGCACVAQTV